MMFFEIVALILIVCILLLSVYKEINDWRVQRWLEKKGDTFATKHSRRPPRSEARHRW